MQNITIVSHKKSQDSAHCTLSFSKIRDVKKDCDADCEHCNYLSQDHDEQPHTVEACICQMHERYFFDDSKPYSINGWCACNHDESYIKTPCEKYPQFLGEKVEFR